MSNHQERLLLSLSFFERPTLMPMTKMPRLQPIKASSIIQGLIVVVQVNSVMSKLRCVSFPAVTVCVFLQSSLVSVPSSPSFDLHSDINGRHPCAECNADHFPVY